MTIKYERVTNKYNQERSKQDLYLKNQIELLEVELAIKRKALATLEECTPLSLLYSIELSLGRRLTVPAIQRTLEIGYNSACEYKEKLELLESPERS